MIATSPAREGQRSGGNLCLAAFSLCGSAKVVPDDIIGTQIELAYLTKKGRVPAPVPFHCLIERSCTPFDSGLPAYRGQLAPTRYPCGAQK